MKRYTMWEGYQIGNINCWYASALHFDYKSPAYANDTECDIEIGKMISVQVSFHILMDGI